MAVSNARSRRWSRYVLIALWLVVRAAPAPAQEPRAEAVLSDSSLRLLAGEVKGQTAFKTLSMIATYHRMLGSDEMAALLRRLDTLVRGYGIRDSRILRVPVPTGRERFWLQDLGGQVPANVRHAELRLVAPFPRLIVTTDGVPSMVVQGSRSADVTADVVFVGRGIDSSDYAGKNVRGQLVLAGNAPLDRIKEVAIHRYGAAGVLYYLDGPSYSGDDPDANLGLWWWPWSERGEPSTFALSLSTTDYRWIKALLDDGKRVRMRATVDADVLTGKDASIEALDVAIPGAQFPDEEFWLVAHIDHPYPGATDNASGAAVVLETARVLQSLIQQRIIPPPRRTIRFLLVPHVAGLSMYLSRHPEKLGHVRGAVSIDGAGVSQTLFSNYFAVSKPSQALSSYWTAVLESLVAHLQARTNRDPMAWDDRDNLFSEGGSRDQFHVRLERYTGGSDEFQLDQGSVGIPTAAFGTVPVPPRHSQLNGTKWIDPSGLRRVSYLTSALAMTFGWTDASNVWRIIDEVYHRGEIHLERASALASRALETASPDARAAARRRGDALIEQIAKREDEALASARALVPGDPAAAARIVRRRASLVERARALRTELGAEHARLCESSGCRAELAPLDDDARRLDRIVPVPRPDVHGTTAYFGNYYVRTLGRDKLASFKLRGGFDYGHVGYAEARNFMDGRRSIREIHDAVAAELWSEGYPESQAIGLDEVERYAKMLEAAEVVTLERR